MKKILFYINSIHEGGAERVMTNLANTFAKRGHECVMVTSFVDKWEYPLCEEVKRITLFRDELKGKVLKNFKLVKALKKTVKDEAPQVVVSFMAEPNFRMLFACRGLKVKKIISVRNDPNREYPNFIYRFLAKNLYKRADGIVFQTEDAQKWFPEAIRDKSIIIFNQVDEVFYNTVFDGERGNIVTTGRLEKQKNHAMLIRAFASVADKIDDDLYIYGEGSLRAELEKLIEDLGLKDRVFLPGQISSVADKIKSAKTFVLSSDYEGMPNALMEAMALGIPCVSTDCPCGGPRAIIEDGEDGLLVPVGDESALADAMTDLLYNREKAEIMGKKAKIKAGKLFSNETVFKQWEDFLCGR